MRMGSIEFGRYGELPSLLGPRQAPNHKPS